MIKIEKKPGVYPNMPNENYHRANGISKSGLDLIARCPALFKYKYIEGNDLEVTKPMIIGSAVHKAVLEPGTFDQEYICAPDINRRTKAGKAELADFQAANKNKVVLGSDDFKEINNIADSVFSHKVARRILERGGDAEVSIFGTDQETDQLVKVRPDLLTAGSIIDLKTTQDGSADGFSKSCANFRYHVQAAFYLDVVNGQYRNDFGDFIFIAVEKKEPYLVSVYFADSEMLELGRDEYRRCLEMYKQCQSTGYSGYNSDMVRPIALPSWYSSRLRGELFYNKLGV